MEPERVRVFITRWAVPRDVVFTDAVCVCVCVCVRALHSHQFLPVSDHCSSATLLNVSAQRVFGRPILLSPIPTSHTDAASVHLRWSILVTWPHLFHLRLCAVATVPLFWFAFPSLSVAPYTLQYSLFHLALESLKHLPSSLQCFWCLSASKTQHSRTRSS